MNGMGYDTVRAEGNGMEGSGGVGLESSHSTARHACLKQ